MALLCSELPSSSPSPWNRSQRPSNGLDAHPGLSPPPPPSVSPYLLPSFPTVHSSFARPASLLFLKHAKHPPTSGPLYLFLVPDMLFLHMSTRLTASHPSGFFSVSRTSLPTLYKFSNPHLHQSLSSLHSSIFLHSTCHHLPYHTTIVSYLPFHTGM